MLNIDYGKQFTKIVDKFSEFVDRSSMLKTVFNNMDISIGMANDNKYGVSPAVLNPIFLTKDSGMIGEVFGLTPDIDMAFKKNRDDVLFCPRYNNVTQKFDIHLKKSQLTKDADVFIPGQIIPGWRASWSEKIFREPLLYSNFDRMVKTVRGTARWADVFNLPVIQYSGFAILSNAGRINNNLSHDISVGTGLMSTQIINLTVSYTLTLEEMEAAKESNGNPYINQLMVEKQRYANYCLHILKSVVGYYGNIESDTIGLLTVNPIDVWTNDSLQEIYEDIANVRKGATAYNYLASIIRDFLGASYNMIDHIVIALAPEAINLLGTLTYSDQFNPKSPAEIVTENIQSMFLREGKKLRVEFVSEPLLAADTLFNPEVFDYMVLTTPDLGASDMENSEQNGITLFAEPLTNFIYPVTPGHNQHFKTLTRMAGVLTPVKQTVKVISGFGKK